MNRAPAFPQAGAFIVSGGLPAAGAYHETMSSVPAKTRPEATSTIVV